MKFNVIRQSRYSAKINNFIRQSDNVIVGRLYDAIMIQYHNRMIFNVETKEALTLDINDEQQGKNEIIDIVKSYMTEDGLNDQIYQVTGPSIRSNYDCEKTDQLKPLIADKIEMSASNPTYQELRSRLNANGWYGLVVLAQKGQLIKCYLLDRQYFDLEMVKNKGDKQLIEIIVNKVYVATKKDRLTIEKTARQMLTNDSIYKYVMSGHLTEFINNMIEVLE